MPYYIYDPTLKSNKEISQTDFQKATQDYGANSDYTIAEGPGGSKVQLPKGMELQSGTLIPQQSANPVSSSITPEVRDARLAATNPVSALNDYLKTQIAGNTDTNAGIEKTRLQERTDTENLLNAKIRDIELKNQQAIDAEKAKEAGLLASQGGINIRAGLGGSPFATASNEAIRGATREKVGTLNALAESEKSIARGQVDQALTQVEERANKALADQEQKQLGLLTTSANLIEQNKTAGLSNLATFAKAGMSFDDVKNSGILDQLKLDTGMDANALEINFKVNLPAKNIDFKMEKVGDKMFVWEVNKNTGQITRRPEMDISAPTANTGEYDTKITDNGSILLIPKVIDPNKTLDEQILQYGKTGEFAKPTIPTEPKAPTQAQSLVAGYANRLEQSMSIMDSIAKDVNPILTSKISLQRNIPNWASAFKNDKVKEQEQAERNFVNAVLRRESGAVISPSEFESAAKQYFPQAGDTAQVLENKKANRELVLKNLIRDAGSAYSQTTLNTTGQSVKLQDPNTGEVREFENMTDTELQDATNQGFKEIK